MFLALVALGITLVERLPRDAREPAVPTGGGDDDVLVLVLGDPEEGATAPAPPPQPGVEGLDYHVVRKGETLSGIARQRLGDATLAGDLALRNGLVDPDTLEPGQVLRLR